MFEPSPKPEDKSTARAGKDVKKRVADIDEIKSQKKVRKDGERPVIATPVRYDLDSDDELICKMKQARYLEKDIADRLQAEGRKNYAPKTIGTRWARIKKVLQLKQDDLLDEGLADWHEGDVSRFPSQCVARSLMLFRTRFSCKQLPRQNVTLKRPKSKPKPRNGSLWLMK